MIFEFGVEKERETNREKEYVHSPRIEIREIIFLPLFSSIG